MTRRVRSSRLTRNADKQSKRQFVFFGIGTIIIIFLLIQFSGTLLSLFGNIIFGIRGDESQAVSESHLEEILLAPTLNSLPNATSSAKIKISGTSSYDNGKIILYLNGRKSDTSKLRNSKKFEFNNVRLSNGENNIKVSYFINDKESDFSQDYTIIRSSEKPKLEINQPADNSTFTKADKNITVSGKTNSNGTVTVNGFRAVVNSSGEFSYIIELDEGDNTIIIEATNEAGVKNSKELSIIYRKD